MSQGSNVGYVPHLRVFISGILVEPVSIKGVCRQVSDRSLSLDPDSSVHLHYTKEYGSTGMDYLKLAYALSICDGL
eukprot:CAMPEP_0184291850 /NCGR_PEP_ID=MMETSP1049-20130417/3731_1 /TAXON_ID=77928 /ORGANISM="Proteomonas sulcata, Strain CCMP704" /LENGTH=75 /DNA_ID=CAMNT_0026599393 /DNA_START=416 /DNA_END=643 /DNA_ORIENTATION=+